MCRSTSKFGIGSWRRLPTHPDRGQHVAGTRALAADFGINFHTVNKAYDLLRQQGLIRLNRKTGAVVISTVADPPFRAEWAAKARLCWPKPLRGGYRLTGFSRPVGLVLDSFGTTQQEDAP